jgi:hypothetical protein
MKRISLIVAVTLFSSSMAGAQSVDCSPLVIGIGLMNPNDGKFYSCTAQGWVERPELQPRSKAGDWRFNPQNSLMEYFDGQTWVAVQIQAQH